MDCSAIEQSIIGDVNDNQREAILHEEGPLLVVAGAGSGKTRVITRRIAWLIHQGHHPASILAITFTNKAADEMKRRVAEMVGEDKVFISTFHSMGARFLRSSGACIDISPRFTIYDSDDQRSLVLETLKNLNLDPAHFRPASVLSAISNLKNSMIGPDEAADQAGSYFETAVANVYAAYAKHLIVNEALDFDDLLVKTFQMFRDNEEVLAHYQRRFRFILIDEYQDTNQVQYLLARSLAGKQGNLCATGDPDQSIYRWRGANLRNILDFEADFPGARVVRLEQNYRSTANIIKAASAVIENNVMRKERALWTESPDGAKVTILSAGDESEEADRVVRFIREQYDRGVAYSKMAIFYRVNALSRLFERSLRLFNIPYAIVGGVEFYKRKEVRDLLAFLKLINNQKDAVSLFRVLNTPPRGIGLTTVKRLKSDALQQGRPPLDLLREYVDNKSVSSRPLKGIRNFLELLDGWSNRENTSIEWLLRRVIDDVGYLDYLEGMNDGKTHERLDNVSELISAVGEYERFNTNADLDGYLEESALVQDIDSWNENSDCVTLMTLHSAKGLEFDLVFFVGVEEGLLPHELSSDDDEEFEEERRLMYVGITRSRKKLFISHAFYRTRFGERIRSRPSPFLDEIPEDVKETESFFSTGPGPLSTVARRPDLGTDTVLEYEEDVWPSFGAGDRVEHPYFGLGEIVHVSGSGPATRLKIHFVRAGERLLVLEHAKLKKVL